MRKALIAGIDYYEKLTGLHGAVNDASSVKDALERHYDGTLNFSQPKLLLAKCQQTPVTREQLRESIAELFLDDAEIALFYFAGHGYIDSAGGYICGSDSTSGHDGIALNDVMAFANQSPAKNKVVILDSCHSGIAGDRSTQRNTAELKDGVTILTASTAGQYAAEEQGGGLFTSLLVDALSGSASNLLGDITLASIYAHVDQSLGTWAQRPVFKTNIKKFISIRHTKPPIDLVNLRHITTLFPRANTALKLDPSYEPERSSLEPTSLPLPDPAKTADFAILQNLARVNLVKPVGAPHMWHAAMGYHSCELTTLGRHYWRLVKQDLI